MKAWRRTSSSRSTGAAVAAPVIVSVTTDGSPDAIVQFSADVTWDGIDAGNLQLDGNAGSWSAQLGTSTLIWTGSVPHMAGEVWFDAGPEPGLAPEPTTPASGLTL